MCTLTAATFDNTLRVVFNRDELRSRSVAMPPRIVRLGGRDAIMPVDTDSGGSWIAVNDGGLVFAVLNVTRTLPAEGSALRLSRGLLIPRVIPCASLAEVASRLEECDPQDFRPFRLLVLTVGAMLEAVSDARRLVVDALNWHGSPVLRTSSGLGDALVQQPRAELFRQSIATGAWTPSQQDAFHAHAWPERSAVSVLMSRPDAHTVSRTTIEVGEASAAMRYTSLPLGQESSLHLTLVTGSHAHA